MLRASFREIEFLRMEEGGIAHITTLREDDGLIQYWSWAFNKSGGPGKAPFGVYTTPSTTNSNHYTLTITLCLLQLVSGQRTCLFVPKSVWWSLASCPLYWPSWWPTTAINESRIFPSSPSERMLKLAQSDNHGEEPKALLKDCRWTSEITSSW